MWRALSLIAITACGSRGAPIVHVDLACDDDHTRALAVPGDLRLDTALCGAPHESLEIEACPRTELVHALPVVAERFRAFGPRAGNTVLALENRTSFLLDVTTGTKSRIGARSTTHAGHRMWSFATN